MAFRSYEDHIADILVAKGFRRFVGATPLDWDITIGRMNDVPNRQITVYKAGGRPKNPRWLLEYPSIQIKVRGGANDYILANQMAEKCMDNLVGIESFTASNGDGIVSITAIGDIAFMGWDDVKRPEYVFNISLIAEPALINRPGTNREPL